MSDTDPYAAPSSLPSTRPLNGTVDVEEVAKSEVPEGTISEVKRWVGSDKDRASLALDAEESSDNPRVTLVSHLKDLLSEDAD